MKYIVLHGKAYYPSKSEDIVGVFETFEEADTFFEDIDLDAYEWKELYDLHRMDTIKVRG